jgi:hypothetical protein
MSRVEIPRAARRIIREYGIDDDGNVIVLAVYWHMRKGHEYPHLYLVQYREVNRRIQPGSRSARQYGGQSGQARLDHDLKEPRELLAESVERFHAREGI